MAYCFIHKVNLSSDCGMFDGVCGACEYEYSLDQEKEDWEALPQCEKDLREQSWIRLPRNGETCLDPYIPF